jgi:hypothetical protein
LRQLAGPHRLYDLRKTLLSIKEQRMKTLSAPRKFHDRLAGLCSAFLLLGVLSASATAQSTDIEFPTPIRANEISGTIAPRDLGDSRLTRYFYSFTGTPGDLIVAVVSRNLDGDIDVFTAGDLRPLAKISLYSGGSSSGGTQTIYLRTRQALILRVEARTPNDSDGTFRVSFSGGFEPISSDIPDPEPIVPTVSSTGTGRRVTATGARIDEPEPEVVAAPQPAPQTPEPATPAVDAPPSSETPVTTAEAEAEKPAPPRPRPRTRRSRGSARTARTRPTPQPVEPAAAGPRLIIETRDGTRVERYMTTVRRVTVERGQLVVVTMDGKVERQPMTNVLRMAIEP